MSRLGKGLFRSRRTLATYFERLPVMLHASIGELIDRGHEGPKLKPSLEKAYLLRPLHVSVLIYTQVDRVSEPYAASDGARRLRSRVQGHVPYEGSRILWGVPLSPGFRFPIPGKVGKKSVKLCALVDGKDIADFETMIDAELGRLHDELHAFQPVLYDYNNRIRSEVDLALRTY